MTTATKKGRKMESDTVTLDQIEQATANELADEEARQQAERDAAMGVLQGMLPLLADNQGVDKARLQRALEAVGWQMPELLAWVSKFRQLQQHQAELDKYDRNELAAEMRQWVDEFAQLEAAHRARLVKRRGLLSMLSAEGQAIGQLKAELMGVGLLHNPAIGQQFKTVPSEESRPFIGP